MQVCLFCGGDASGPNHRRYCDGRQGAIEAAAPPDTYGINDPLPVVVTPSAAGWLELTNEQRFERFDAANPHVYERLLALALHLRARGVKRAGIKLLVERLRWTYLETNGDPYKLNNTYAPYFARKIMANDPLLEGFFETRASPHDPRYYERIEEVII